MKLQINKYTWTIKLKTNKELQDEANDKFEMMWGLCCYDRLEIWINEKINPQLLKGCVIHELVHAYIFSFNISNKIECDYAEMFSLYGKDILEDGSTINKNIREKLGWDK